MGSHPYVYLTPYQADLNAALQSLRQQEFAAGRYYPAVEAPWELPFPPTETSIGAQHASMEAALEDAADSGTGSILDIQGVAPAPSLLAASPLPDDDLLALWGTVQPSAMQLIDLLLDGVSEPVNPSFDVEVDFWEQIGRGECRYIVLYEDEVPSLLFFVGYSLD